MKYYVLYMSLSFVVFVFHYILMYDENKCYFSSWEKDR